MTRLNVIRQTWHLCALMLVLLLPLAACSPSGASSRQASGAAASTGRSISVSGAFALFPMVTIWTEEYSNLHPEITFDVQAGGAGKGMTDMLSGAADIAMLSREARQEELDQGAFLVPVAIDAVVATVNADNPHLDELMAQGITPEEAHGIWVSGEINSWRQLLGVGGDDAINVYTRSDASGAGEMWALFSLAQAQEDLSGTAVNADPGLAEAVRQDALGIGYNNIGFVYDLASGAPNEGIRAVPLDLNGDGQIGADEAFYDTREQITQAIAAEIYPFPPARVLYLVTKGEPDSAIVDFYRWILTDGQAFIPGGGYVAVNENLIEQAIQSLP